MEQRIVPVRLELFLKEKAATVPTREKHAAAIVFKKRIIAVGVNQSKTHPMAAKFSKNESAIFIHAEIAAILDGIKQYGVGLLPKSTLIVCRVLANGSLANSCPCEGCKRAVAAFGLRVIHSTQEGDWKYGDVQDS